MHAFLKGLRHEIERNYIFWKVEIVSLESYTDKEILFETYSGAKNKSDKAHFMK